MFFLVSKIAVWLKRVMTTLYKRFIPPFLWVQSCIDLPVFFVFTWRRWILSYIYKGNECLTLGKDFHWKKHDESILDCTELQISGLYKCCNLGAAVICLCAESYVFELDTGTGYAGACLCADNYMFWTWYSDRLYRCLSVCTELYLQRNNLHIGR